MARSRSSDGAFTGVGVATQRKRAPAKGAASEPSTTALAAPKPQRAERGFLAALAADFREHGEAAIRAARESNPATYLRLVGALLGETTPRRPLDDLTDEELASAIAAVRSIIAEQDAKARRSKT